MFARLSGRGTIPVSASLIRISLLAALNFHGIISRLLRIGMPIKDNVDDGHPSPLGLCLQILRVPFQYLLSQSSCFVSIIAGI